MITPTILLTLAAVILAFTTWFNHHAKRRDEKRRAAADLFARYGTKKRDVPMHPSACAAAETELRWRVANSPNPNLERYAR